MPVDCGVSDMDKQGKVLHCLVCLAVMVVAVVNFGNGESGTPETKDRALG